jgi:hypothetical protein
MSPGSRAGRVCLRLCGAVGWSAAQDWGWRPRRPANGADEAVEKPLGRVGLVDDIVDKGRESWIDLVNRGSIWCWVRARRWRRRCSALVLQSGATSGVVTELGALTSSIEASYGRPCSSSTGVGRARHESHSFTWRRGKSSVSVSPCSSGDSSADSTSRGVIYGRPPRANFLPTVPGVSAVPHSRSRRVIAPSPPASLALTSLSSLLRAAADLSGSSRPCARRQNLGEAGHVTSDGLSLSLRPFLDAQLRRTDHVIGESREQLWEVSISIDWKHPRELLKEAKFCK